jgi:hypothetical protein
MYGKYLEQLIQKLYDQYNSQNDTSKPMLSEEYKYTLTESEFDIIMKGLKEQLDA